MFRRSQNIHSEFLGGCSNEGTAMRVFAFAFLWLAIRFACFPRDMYACRPALFDMCLVEHVHQTRAIKGDVRSNGCMGKQTNANRR